MPYGESGAVWVEPDALISFKEAATVFLILVYVLGESSHI
jgi:hypothetical protein